MSMKLRHMATLAAIAGTTATYAMKPKDILHNFTVFNVEILV